MLLKLTGCMQRFSSVVGPNGSGKSNVIDAMLFVFGKKAKQLRLNKVSELIHKSEAYMNLQMCKVSVHFVEIEDQVPIPWLDDVESIGFSHCWRAARCEVLVLQARIPFAAHRPCIQVSDDD